MSASGHIELITSTVFAPDISVLYDCLIDNDERACESYTKEY